jgi:hypothetical protein
MRNQAKARFKISSTISHSETMRAHHMRQLPTYLTAFCLPTKEAFASAHKALLSAAVCCSTCSKQLTDLSKHQRAKTKCNPAKHQNAKNIKMQCCKTHEKPTHQRAK